VTKGYKIPLRTEEHRKKLSESLKGNQNCFGRIVSEETRKKIGEANKRALIKALDDQKRKMIQIISNRLREVGIGIQNYTEALDNPEYEEYDTMTVKKAIAHGDGLIVELKKLLKEVEELK